MSTVAQSDQKIGGLMALMNAESNKHVVKAPRKKVKKKNKLSNCVVINQARTTLLAKTSQVTELDPSDKGNYHVIRWASYKMTGFGMAVVQDKQLSHLILYIACGKLLRIVPNEMHDDLDKSAPMHVKVLGLYEDQPSVLADVVKAVESFGVIHDHYRFTGDWNCNVVSYSTPVMQKIKQPTIIVKGAIGGGTSNVMVPRKGVYMIKWKSESSGGYGLFCSIPRRDHGEILIYSETDQGLMLTDPNSTDQFKMGTPMCVWIMMEYRKVKLLDFEQLVAQLQQDDGNLKTFVANLSDDNAVEK